MPGAPLNLVLRPIALREAVRAEAQAAAWEAGRALTAEAAVEEWLKK